MPIIGVIDSAKSGNLEPATGFYSIASTSASGTANTVTFTDIASYWKGLQIRIWAMNSSGAGTFDAQLTFNGSTTTYYYNATKLSASTYSRPNSDNDTNIPIGFIYGNSNNTNDYACTILEIADPGKVKKKAFYSFAGMTTYPSTSTTRLIQQLNGMWDNTAPITSITITSSSGNFKAGSLISLYGWV